MFIIDLNLAAIETFLFLFALASFPLISKGREADRLLCYQLKPRLKFYLHEAQPLDTASLIMFFLKTQTPQIHSVILWGPTQKLPMLKMNFQPMQVEPWLPQACQCIFPCQAPRKGWKLDARFHLLHTPRHSQFKIKKGANTWLIVFSAQVWTWGILMWIVGPHPNPKIAGL